MAAVANTREFSGTTTVSPLCTMRGGPSRRVVRNTRGTPSARPTRSAAGR